MPCKVRDMAITTSGLMGMTGDANANQESLEKTVPNSHSKGVAVRTEYAHLNSSSVRPLISGL